MTVFLFESADVGRTMVHQCLYVWGHAMKGTTLISPPAFASVGDWSLTLLLQVAAHSKRFQSEIQLGMQIAIR